MQVCRAACPPPLSNGKELGPHPSPASSLTNTPNLQLAGLGKGSTSFSNLCKGLPTHDLCSQARMQDGAVESSSSCWRSTTSTVCSDRLLMSAPGHKAAPRSSPPANRSAYAASAITAKLHNDGGPAASQTPSAVACRWMLASRGSGCLHGCSVPSRGRNCHRDPTITFAISSNKKPPV